MGALGRMRAFADGLWEEVLCQKDRLILWAPVPLGIGIWGYFALPFEPLFGVSALFLFLCAIGTFCVSKSKYDRGHFFGLYLIGMTISFAMLGVCAAQVSGAMNGTPVLTKNMKYAALTGTVETIDPLEQGRGSRIVLSDIAIEKVTASSTPKRVRVTLKKDQGLAIGQRIELLASLSPPSGPPAPNAYNFRRHFYFEGIGATGFAYKAPVIIAPAPPASKASFVDMRETIVEAIAQSQGPRQSVGGIMAALMTGERGTISAHDNQVMRQSGLYHLLSISGSHVAMVAAIFFFMSRLMMAGIPWLALRAPIKKIAAAIAMVGAGFYVVLAGAEVPAVRALMMTSIVMIAIILDRSPISLRLVCIAAFCILLMSPQSLLGVSFQLSFAAVLALVSFYEAMRQKWQSERQKTGVWAKCRAAVLAVSTTSLIAGTATGVFGLYHFQMFAVYGVIANILVTPLMGFVIMPSAMVSAMTVPFSFLSGVTAHALDVMAWGVKRMLAIAEWTAAQDYSVFMVHQWGSFGFATFVIGFVILCLWDGMRGRSMALVFIVLGLICASLYKPADFMIAGSGKAYAIHAETGEVYATKANGEGFLIKSWMRMWGRDEHTKPLPIMYEPSPMICDDFACRYEAKTHRKLSVVTLPESLAAECAWADIVFVPSMPVEDTVCPKPRVIDLFDLRRGGVYAVWMDGGDTAPRIWTSFPYQSKRPWD